MRSEPGFDIRQGLRAQDVDQAASHYWVAFERKLRLPLGPRPKALAFLGQVLNPAFAFSAIAEDGLLLGVAGFKTPEGAFIEGDYDDLTATYGKMGGFFRGLMLSVLEREIEDNVLLLDGLFVTEAARGQGVGTCLLDALVAHARREGLRWVRLDVVDTNSRARALYERFGFRETGRATLGPLSYLFGFKEAVTMMYDTTRA